MIYCWHFLLLLMQFNSQLAWKFPTCVHIQCDCWISCPVLELYQYYTRLMQQSRKWCWQYRSFTHSYFVQNVIYIYFSGLLHVLIINTVCSLYLENRLPCFNIIFILNCIYVLHSSSWIEAWLHLFNLNTSTKFCLVPGYVSCWSQSWLALACGWVVACFWGGWWGGRSDGFWIQPPY